jgi:hypothetical protein
MSRFSTLNYLIFSYYSGRKEVESYQNVVSVFDNAMNSDEMKFEPSLKSINAILNFASQCEVLKSQNAGNIELNLN